MAHPRAREHSDWLGLGHVPTSCGGGRGAVNGRALPELHDWTSSAQRNGMFLEKKEPVFTQSNVVCG